MTHKDRGMPKEWSSGKSQVKVLFSLVLILMAAGFLLFGVDPYRAFPYVNSRHFNSAREFVTFRKDLWAGTIYDWTRGIHPVRNGSNVRYDSIDPDHPLSLFRATHARIQRLWLPTPAPDAK